MALAPTQSLVETPSRAFYRQAMEVLTRAQVPFLVGGAFAFVHQAGIDRSTKDLDIFVRPADVHRLLEVCAAAGYEAELVFSHWLAKIRSPDGLHRRDLQLGQRPRRGGRRLVRARHRAERARAHGAWSRPPEESLWSKAFVMERERFDGADVAHIILAYGERLDWRPAARAVRPALAGAAGPSRSCSASSIPSARSRVPAWVMRELLRAARAGARCARCRRSGLLRHAALLVPVPGRRASAATSATRASGPTAR